MVECFAPRYLVNNGAPAALLQKLAPTLTPPELIQLLFLYTCRANLILADFIRQVYWDRYMAGHESISNQDARAFVIQAVRDGKTRKLWSDSMIKNGASYLTGCCADYGLLEKGQKSNRKILPFQLESKVAAYLAHDLHFAGLGDNSVISHEDWALFGLDRSDVRNELKRLSLKGYVIIQSAGEVTCIGWHYNCMEALTDVIQNVASFMHPAIHAPSQLDDVKTAAEKMIAEPLVPFGEQDGNLCFSAKNSTTSSRNAPRFRSVRLRRGAL